MDWAKYNEQLGKRDEFYPSLDFLSAWWGKELDQMNRDKCAYGESVNARRFDMTKKEAILKFILYSTVKNSC